MSILETLIKKKASNRLKLDGIPEFEGLDIFAKPLGIKSLIKLSTSISTEEKGKVDSETIDSMVTAIAGSLCDEDGNLIFQEPQGVEYIEELPMDSLVKTFNKIVSQSNEELNKDIKRKKKK